MGNNKSKSSGDASLQSKPILALIKAERVARLKDLEKMAPFYEPPAWNHGKLKKCTFLDLCQKHLTAIPLGVFELSRLAKIDLQQNFLSSLPGEISLLTRLNFLNLGQNNISSLPDELSRLTNLTHLDVDESVIQYLPPSLTKVAYLAKLKKFYPIYTPVGDSLGDCTYLSLTGGPSYFPPVVFEMTRLVDLFFHNNYFFSLTDEISKLSKITQLQLFGNCISLVPPSISTLANLAHFNISSNYVSILPRELFTLTRLTTLIIHNNPIEEIPLEVTALRDLYDFQIAYVRNMHIQRAPRGISNLPCWKNPDRPNEGVQFIESSKRLLLFDSHQGMWEPEWTPNSTQMEFNSLSFYDASLSELPASLSLLTNLTYLCLRKNHFTTIPECIIRIVNMQSLDLSINQLKSIPESISSMHNLVSLDISENKILDLS